MPATPARIGFITQEFRRVTATSAQAAARHGNLARQSEDPIETFFDDVADAQDAADERQALLSPERRRFQVQCNSIEEAMALDYMGAVPLARYIDTERSANRGSLVSEIVIDLHTSTATLTVWG